MALANRRAARLPSKTMELFFAVELSRKKSAGLIFWRGPLERIQPGVDFAPLRGVGRRVGQAKIQIMHGLVGVVLEFGDLRQAIFGQETFGQRFFQFEIILPGG